VIATPEQEQALDLFGQSVPLVIEAGAGTGKTTTLDLLARSTPRTGTYIAFNRSIANDAHAKFPVTVTARTMHSFAWQAVAGHLDAERRLRAPRMYGAQTAKILGIGPIYAEVEGRTKVLQPSFLAGHVMRAVQTFCASGDRTINYTHFRHVPGIDPPGSIYRPNNEALTAELLPTAADAWFDLIRPSGKLRFTHDVYLKIWQLGRYSLPGDYILFDEAQDANPVMLAAVEQQADEMQRVYVGDAQQQIYEWRGAVNALDTLAGTRCWLTQSFRFGPPIAEVANALLEWLDADLRLVGTDTVRSSIGHVPQPRATLCRSNAGALDIVVREQAAGRSTHLIGDADEVIYFATQAAKLQAGQRTDHPDLACFESWREVKDYVDNEPGGDELRMLVRLLDEYGIAIVIDALEGQSPEAAADVVVSTAHKAKGREWPTVRLAGDFDPGDDRPLSDPELRLLYVACTRAQERLDVTACETIREMVA
jgi:AAA domain/UvrD-like helicase C-terminal domain